MPTTTGVATEFITFTRASNATVTDSDGKVKWAPHNLLLASESFDAAAWGKTSVTPTANSIAAPNGTTTADTLAASGANGTTLQTFTAEAISYTFGVWLKRKTGTGNIQIAADSGTYTTVTITSDWALYTVTQTPAAGSKSAGIRIVTSADEVYAWGASLYRSDLGGMQPNTSAYPLYNPTTVKNLLGYTESLTTGWTNSNTTDAIVSEVNPVGLTGAVDVASTSGNGTLLGSLSLLASPYTFSIWLKRKTGSGTVEITVDGTTYVTAAVTGTWTRFSTPLTPTAGTKTPGIRLVTSGDAVYVWGAQLSDSASLDSYSPVYGAAVTSAAYYGPRRDFDPVTLACKGLLVEEQRTNLQLNSNVFGTSTYLTTVVAGAAASPSGLIDASSLACTSTSGRAILSTSVTSGIVYTFSVFIKAGTNTSAYIELAGTAGSGGAVVFNLSSGTVTSGTGGAIVPAPNGFYRCSVTSTATGTGASDMRIGTGDATSKTVFVYGAQLEANASFATSYIPVGATSAGATRNADVASVSTQAFPYSATEGTIVVNVDMVGTSATAANGFFNISDGTTTSFPGVSWIAAYGDTSIILSNRRANNVNATNISSSVALTLNTPFKVGLAVAVGGTDSATINGGTIASQPGVASAYTNSILRLGSFAPGYVTPTQLNGHIRQITYLPRRISNAELQTRTA